MGISGLMVTLEDDPSVTASVLHKLSEAGPFEVGPLHGRRLAVALEAADDAAACEWFDWLGRVPGVVKVDVAFVYFNV